MSRTPITEEHLTWLRDNHATQTVEGMARHVGVCADTLRRILVREGLREFSGAKYQPAAPKPAMWTRPCIVCKDDEYRPRNHYMCSRCRRSAGYSD